MGYNTFLFSALEYSSTFSSDGTEIIFCSVEMVIQGKTPAITDGNFISDHHIQMGNGSKHIS